MVRVGLVVLATVCLAGCVRPRSGDAHLLVSDSIDSRIGAGLRPEAEAGLLVPDGISLADGISETDAAAIALWNNAAFQTDLTVLGFARADLVEAGLLRNPILSLLFPVGPKQLEATATLPLEVFWQRPRRVELADLNLERVAHDLVQHGLDLGRDARTAHVDLALAGDRVILTEEAFQLTQDIADITQARLDAGDVSVLDRNLAEIQARMAEEAARQARQAAATSESHLRLVLGLVDDSGPLEVVASSTDVPEVPEVGEALEDAFASRPDLRAAELAMEAAAAQAGLADSEVFQLSAVLDMNGSGTSGFEAGPGVSFNIPFLSQNDGVRSRAGAELDRTARGYVAVQHQIASDVREALIRLTHAIEALGSWRNSILPPLEAAFDQTERAYTAGEASYLAVLESQRQLVEARLSEAGAEAELRRSRAELERSIGRNRFGL